MKFSVLVFCSLCLALVLSKKTYRAGVYRSHQNSFDVVAYDVMIQEAAKENVDILVLPSPELCILDKALEKSSFRPENFNEVVSAISSSAKKAGIYVVARLYEMDLTGPVKTNVVLDRNGATVSTYRKPVDNVANMTSEVGSFTSNFGVLFAVLTEDDLVLKNLAALKNLHNYIVLGSSDVDNVYLEASELLSSWAYTTKANFITESNIYGANIKNRDSKLLIADLHKDEAEHTDAPWVNSADLGNALNFIKYSIKPVDLEASVQGYEDTVCKDKNCCSFYIKSGLSDSTKNTFDYGLAVFNGLQSYGDHNIGVQHCVVFAYTGLYKHATDFGKSQNKTSVNFDILKISYNITNMDVVILPTLVSGKAISNNQFDFNTKCVNGNNRATIEAVNVDQLSVFGIFGRNFTQDFVDVKNGNGTSYSWDIYDYIYSERIQDCFDYLWISLRVLLFLVSIYILEMM